MATSLNVGFLNVTQELSEQYKGSGERSVEAAAGLVGLRLPEKPEDT